MQELDFDKKTITCDKLKYNCYKWRSLNCRQKERETRKMWNFGIGRCCWQIFNFPSVGTDGYRFASGLAKICLLSFLIFKGKKGSGVGGFVLELLIFTATVAATAEQTILPTNVIISLLAIFFPFILSHTSFLLFTLHSFNFFFIFRRVIAEAATATAFAATQSNTNEKNSTNHWNTDDHCFKVEPANSPARLTKSTILSIWENVFDWIDHALLWVVAPHARNIFQAFIAGGIQSLTGHIRIRARTCCFHSSMLSKKASHDRERNPGQHQQAWYATFAFHHAKVAHFSI